MAGSSMSRTHRRLAIFGQPSLLTRLSSRHLTTRQTLASRLHPQRSALSRTCIFTSHSSPPPRRLQAQHISMSPTGPVSLVRSLPAQKGDDTVDRIRTLILWVICSRLARIERSGSSRSSRRSELKMTGWRGYSGRVKLAGSLGMRSVFRTSFCPWLTRSQWDAYPVLSPTTNYSPMVLDDGLYYVNGFETFVNPSN